MNTSWVCVDASLVIKLVVEETYSVQARTLWRTWLNATQTVAAPPLLRYEITSVLRKQAARNLQSVEDSQKALDLALSFGINYLEPSDFHRRAFDMACRLNRPAAYDAHYLALAEHLDCEFWTADERLVNSVQEVLPWVKWLGHAP